MIQVDVIAGEKGEKDYVRFSLTSATDDYTSISMHAINEAIMKYHEEYFHRIPGTYNLACSTKARDGILSVKIVSSGGNKYLGSKDPQKSLKRSIMMRDVLSEVTTKSFILLASAVDTSYFAAKRPTKQSTTKIKVRTQKNSHRATKNPAL